MLPPPHPDSSDAGNGKRQRDAQMARPTGAIAA